MNDEPVIEQVRKAREAYAAQFNFNIAAMCDDLRRLTEEAARKGYKVIEPPKRNAITPPKDSQRAAG